MDERLDGWMDEWKDREMERWVDGWVDVYKRYYGNAKKRRVLNAARDDMLWEGKMFISPGHTLHVSISQ